MAVEKPSELIAFDTGREVMEQLRNKHASVSVALEALCAEIGESRVLAAVCAGHGGAWVLLHVQKA